MKTLTRRALAALCLATLASTGMAADAWPSKPITLVVPYPAGGSNDVFARLVGRALGDALHQPVIVDNRPGASGNVGAGQVAHAAPDGYTLAAVSSSITTNAAIQPKMPFDVVKGFAPVAMVAKGPFIVAVNNDLPVKTPAELIATLKKQPGKLNYATSGIGSINQFGTELFKAATGTDIVHVPYKGMGNAVTGLIGGETQLLISSVPSLLPQVRGGRIRAIAITSLNPSPLVPGLVPMSTAVPGFEFEMWWGVLAPAGTPKAIVDKLNAEINKILASPEAREAFLKEGAVPTPISPAAFGTTLASDIARWKKLAQQQNIVAE